MTHLEVVILTILGSQ